MEADDSAPPSGDPQMMKTETQQAREDDEEWEFVPWTELAALGNAPRKENERSALQSLEDSPNIPVDSICFSNAQQLLGKTHMFMEIPESEDVKASRRHIMSVLGIYLDIAELEDTTKQMKAFTHPVIPRNVPDPQVNNNFHWFHGRVLLQIAVRLLIGFILFGRGVVDFRHSITYVIITLLSYLFEIGAFQHLLRIFDQPDNIPNNNNANAPHMPNLPVANAPAPNVGQQENLRAADGQGNAAAAPQSVAQPPQPRMSWSRYIARRLRAGVGLPTQDGIFFDLCAFVIGFVGSLVPEWNPYGHMHV